MPAFSWQWLPYLLIEVLTAIRDSRGNSGGPLVNKRGQVIGVNDQIESTTLSGVGFAIPSSTALNIREGPGTGYAIVTVAQAGDEPAVTGHSADGWHQVSLADGGPVG